MFISVLLGLSLVFADKDTMNRICPVDLKPNQYVAGCMDFQNKIIYIYEKEKDPIDTFYHETGHYLFRDGGEITADNFSRHMRGKLEDKKLQIYFNNQITNLILKNKLSWLLNGLATLSR